MTDTIGRVCRLRENQYYSLADLVMYMHRGADFVQSFVDYMRKQEVCKTNVSNQSYSFRFVGLIEFEGLGHDFEFGKNERLFIYIVPKFFPDSLKDEDGLAEGEKIVLRAILKYRKDQRTSLFSNGRLVAETGCSTKVSTYLALILDAMENGVYSVPHEELVRGGKGEIDWNETFRTSDPIFMREGPCYANVITREISYEEESYISRLEMCLVTRCIDYFDEIGLLDTLGLTVDFPCDSTIDEFGSVGYCLARIDGELKTQFVDTKQHTLRLMRAVLSNEGYGADSLGFQSFGMSGFHELWERAIKDVFEDEINKRVCDLGFHVEKKKASKTLLEYIEPPLWISLAEENEGTCEEKESNDVEADRLEPDFVAVAKKEGGEVLSLIILDAKYYKPYFRNGKIVSQPGVGDVDKQVLYKLAYRDLPVKTINNAFLFPGYEEGDVDLKRVPLTFKPFARIDVPVFKGLDSSFVSFKVNGLGLLQRYVENRPDADRVVLRNAFGLLDV